MAKVKGANFAKRKIVIRIYADVSVVSYESHKELCEFVKIIIANSGSIQSCWLLHDIIINHILMSLDLELDMWCNT